MRKRVLLVTILLLVTFSSQMYAHAANDQNSSLQTNFEQINRGYPNIWTITSRGSMHIEPVLCDLEGDGQQELIIIDNQDGLILVNAEDGNQIWTYFTSEGINHYVPPQVSEVCPEAA